MSLIQFPENFHSLRDQTVVITGGASGIGEAFVRLACENGAHVVFGDLQDELGGKVALETGATFVKTDVSKYKELLRLFDEAYKKHGAVDHAIANAGIYEPKGLFDPSTDLQSLDQEPPTSIVDVNLRGVLFFAHIAAVYLRQGDSAHRNKSLTLVSSTAGILCPAETPLYNTTKSGVLGLSRSLAGSLATTHGIRVNGMCPSVTATPLSALHVLPVFESLQLPVNSSHDVAKVLAGLCIGEEWNGKILYVEGGKAWDIEEGLTRTRPEWLGASVLKTLDKITEYRAQARDTK
ncbi:hypothetical protein Z517_10042 [Fonsecaea pedrosoi CBS 271.37]|uniref:Uncharacterized protein n=1 Tax=Fonsecaea pedrosoi CBS 271.37 TaxID=1442368 RepID=A0A0D2DIX3_9EURO|nr:uncharacterized protein Z517_10042 [Fonsecaea pedrosoi CBS 271.37]KIW77596.1 hypothetical protein Z517_10042 [Fonsecaea pedrosoi CBS 271.37]